MTKLNFDFSDLEVRLWDGDEWPERRVSLACIDSKHAVMISPRYADIGQAQANAEEIAMRCRYHDRLVEALRKSIHVGESEMADLIDAAKLLDELSAHNGGEG